MEKIILLLFSIINISFLNAQFDFEPMNNMSKVYLGEKETVKNNFLLWYYYNERNEYYTDTVFYVQEFEKMYLNYIIDYSELNKDDTIEIIINDSIKSIYNILNQQYLINDQFFYSGHNISFRNVIEQFKNEQPNDTVSSVDSIKYFSFKEQELKYYKINSPSLDKIHLIFKSKHKDPRSNVRFVLYGQFKDFLQQIIYLPCNESFGKPIMRVCYNKLNDSNPIKNKKKLYLTDLNFPITNNEYRFYKTIEKR